MVIPYEIMTRQDKNGVSLFHIVSCTLRTVIRSDDGEATRVELQALSSVKFIPVRELKDGNMVSKKSLDQIPEGQGHLHKTYNLCYIGISAISHVRD